MLLADIAHAGRGRLHADPAAPRAEGLTGRRRFPAAALTAFARDEDRQQALDAGFQLHLAKPIDADSLVAAVASLGKLSVSPASAH